MVHLAVQHVASQLGLYLRRRYGLTEEMVVASGLVQSDGAPVPQSQNKLVVVLVNVERDTLAHASGFSGGGIDGRMGVRTAPIYLNLHLLLVANFGPGSYGEALKFLSSSIAFFQRTPVFDHSNSPDLPPGIEKLMTEIENMRLQELSNLWSMLGAKHAPSVLYKVRMVAVGGGDLVEAQPFVHAPEPSVAGGWR